MRWKKKLKAETIKTRKPKSHRHCDKTGRKLFISIRERTGEGKKTEKMPPREKTLRGKYAEWKKVILREADGG